jgi:hypothetical protein
MKNGSGFTLFLAALALLTSGCNVAPSSQPQERASPERANASLNIRYQVDAARNRIWWISGDRVYLHDAAMPKRIELTLPNWMWVGAPYSCPPDLALGPNGEVVISSNILPTLWRIDPETLAVSEHPLALDADTDKDVGFSGLTYSAGHAAFFAVSGVHGSLWRIDPRLRRAQKVALSAPISNACGLAAQSGFARRVANERSGVCVRTTRDDWIVSLAPDERSGYVRQASCAERPWLLSQLSLRTD